MPPAKTVLVTGANGVIGQGVCRAFSQAGWTTYGLIRSARSAPDLVREEIIPIVGSATNYSSFLDSLPPIDVLVSCSEDIKNYKAHFDDVLAMFLGISSASPRQGGSKPLVIFSSGCKDYGTTARHGDPNLAPHTEDSPLNPPALLANRTQCAMSMFSHTEAFDAVITRPTTIFGRWGSWYAVFFMLAEAAKAAGHNSFTLYSTPNAILHGAHVDDVGRAYVAIAEAPRQVVAGQVYNVSAHSYETLADIATAVEKSHGVKVVYADPGPDDDKEFGVNSVFNFSQWVDSTKLRSHTGWLDRKPLFHEAYGVYRRACEQAKADKSDQFVRYKEYLSFLKDPRYIFDLEG
ncbi:hypothetical protein Z517_11727 [Fonsecaea pedrosoi CBS 271.37]|uniref:NAD-dependent epimerase/dehydratase domain-containing protein n=1 Tax=Fonsecaea pedrosoi CBS 271.37 TaxID=1442368 RepID=A0A0D2DBJ2_9EURO|nr:uncharacterized protein Z517_11727 [Fonsecaea pedrosoi CBS 271.37]KIW74956.1 hypothetical protein Z517_11727 [Fonsecaea pedrosoi CBS 271.37]